MDILNTWMKDIPQQFQGKGRIEILIRAFAKQLQELHQVYRDLEQLTDLEKSAGVNLDRVGGIVCLSRKEAAGLIEKKSDVIMDDERYRQLLKYKILLNTNECTYKEIIAGMEYLYDYRFRYREEKKYPATIILDMPTDLDTPDLAWYRELCIRPSGVQILCTKSFELIIQMIIQAHAKSILFKTEFYPRFNIPFLMYDGTARYEGRYKYNGYKTDAMIDLYPLRLAVRTDCKPAPYPLPKISMQGTVKEQVSGGDTVFRLTAEGKAEHGAQHEIKMKQETRFMPKYAIHLMIGKHLTRYDSTFRYDGTRKYDSEIIREVV